MLVTLAGMITVSKGQSQKASLPILTTLSGIDISDRFLQPLKHDSPSLVTVDGI